MPPPLPRSLDPLADESLPGYVLRLAHRLDLAPARILFLTGLSPLGKPAKRQRMMALDTAAAATFTSVTKLTPPETPTCA